MYNTALDITVMHMIALHCNGKALLSFDHGWKPDQWWEVTSIGGHLYLCPHTKDTDHCTYKHCIANNSSAMHTIALQWKALHAVFWSWMKFGPVMLVWEVTSVGGHWHLCPHSDVPWNTAQQSIERQCIERYISEAFVLLCAVHHLIWVHNNGLFTSCSSCSSSKLSHSPLLSTALQYFV